jgi:hypothetical protein
MEKAQYETLTGTQGAPTPAPAAKAAPRAVVKPLVKAAVSQVSADDDLI